VTVYYDAAAAAAATTAVDAALPAHHHPPTLFRPSHSAACWWCCPQCVSVLRQRQTAALECLPPTSQLPLTSLSALSDDALHLLHFFLSVAPTQLRAASPAEVMVRPCTTAVHLPSSHSACCALLRRWVFVFTRDLRIGTSTTAPPSPRLHPFRVDWDAGLWRASDDEPGASHGSVPRNRTA
jgi:hypothetical protein